MTRIALRAFDGSLDDARGILAVEQATFNDCPYYLEQMVQLITAGGQWVWVAEVDGSVVGFVTAFLTRSLQAASWEVDLLAVHPGYQRQGIGTALVRQAVTNAAGSGALQARAVVALKNHASRRAFESVGFEPLPGTFNLMRCVISGAVARPPVPGMDMVRPLSGKNEAHDLLRLASLPHSASEIVRLANHGTNAFLVAGRGNCVSAFVEMVRVQTLLYTGAWVEMVVTSRPQEAAPLIASAVEWCRARELDEIGCLVPVADWRLRQTFVSEGFASEGEYLVMVRTLGDGSS